MCRYTLLKSLMEKIEEIGYFSLLWMILDENRSYTGIFFLLEGVLAIRHLCIVTSEAAHIFTAWLVFLGSKHGVQSSFTQSKKTTHFLWNRREENEGNKWLVWWSTENSQSQVVLLYMSGKVEAEFQHEYAPSSTCELIFTYIQGILKIRLSGNLLMLPLTSLHYNILCNMNVLWKHMKRKTLIWRW